MTATLATRTRRSIVALLIGAAFAGGIPTTAAASSFRPCEEPKRNVFRLRANGVGCKKAREVSSAYDRKRFRTGTFPPEGEAEQIRGFACTTDQTGYEVYKVRCVSGEAVILFGWGL